MTSILPQFKWIWKLDTQTKQQLAQYTVQQYSTQRVYTKVEV